MITCACTHPEQMYLQLRGLCPHSHLDTFYVPRNRKMSGAVELIGLMTSDIAYDDTTVSWTLKDHFMVSFCFYSVWFSND